jgi:hypothetical protein
MSCTFIIITFKNFKTGETRKLNKFNYKGKVKVKLSL